MSQSDTIRVWKDPQYRNHIKADQQVLWPEHPAGSIELADSELDQAAGGTDTPKCTFITCDLTGVCCIDIQ